MIRPLSASIGASRLSRVVALNQRPATTSAAGEVFVQSAGSGSDRLPMWTAPSVKTVQLDSQMEFRRRSERTRGWTEAACQLHGAESLAGPVLDALASIRVNGKCDLSQATQAIVSRVAQGPIPAQWLAPSLHLLQEELKKPQDADRHPGQWLFLGEGVKTPQEFLMAGPKPQSALETALTSAWMRGDFHIWSGGREFWPSSRGLACALGDLRVSVQGSDVSPVVAPPVSSRESSANALLKDIPDYLNDSSDPLRYNDRAQAAWQSWKDLAKADPLECRQAVLAIAQRCAIPESVESSGYSLHKPLARLTSLIQLANSEPTERIHEVVSGMVEDFVQIPVKLQQRGMLQSGSGHVEGNRVPELFLGAVAELARPEQLGDSVVPVALRFLEPGYFPMGSQLNKVAQLFGKIVSLQPKLAEQLAPALLRATPQEPGSSAVLEALSGMTKLGWQADSECLADLAARALVGTVHSECDGDDRRAVMQLLSLQEAARPGLLAKLRVQDQPFGAALLDTTLKLEKAPSGARPSGSSWESVEVPILAGLIASSPETQRTLWKELGGESAERASVAAQLLSCSKLDLATCQREAAQMGLWEHHSGTEKFSGPINHLRNELRKVIAREGTAEEAFSVLPFCTPDEELKALARTRSRDLPIGSTGDLESLRQWFSGQSLENLTTWKSEEWVKLACLEAASRNQPEVRREILEQVKPALLLQLPEHSGIAAALEPWRLATLQEGLEKLSGPRLEPEALHGTLTGIMALYSYDDRQMPLVEALAGQLGVDPKIAQELPVWRMATSISQGYSGSAADLGRDVKQLLLPLGKQPQEAVSIWQVCEKLHDGGVKSWPRALHYATRHVLHH